MSNPQFDAFLGFPNRSDAGVLQDFGLVQDLLNVLVRPLRKKIGAAQLEQTKLRVGDEMLRLAAATKSAFYTLQARQQLVGRLELILGHRFWVVETDGGPIPRAAWWPETTLNIMPGTTRAVEFVADAPGDWPLHCHKNHHAMNAMGHDIPNVIGVDQEAVAEKIRALVPGYAMAMGSTGMAEHAVHGEHLTGLPNTLPMMTGRGPFGNIEMGGMFTVVKVREGITSYEDPGWYEHPPRTVAWKVGAEPRTQAAAPAHIHEP